MDVIADVQLKNGYYQVFDQKGHKIEDFNASSYGELCGFGEDFIVFLKNNYYKTYESNGDKIDEVSTSKFEFMYSNGSVVAWKGRSTIYYCDKKGEQLGERHI